jgi:hypothetical protein
MGMSVQQAAMKALRVYLAAQFAQLYDPDVESERVQVLENWPEAGVKLPKRGVTILMSGKREDTHLDAELVRQTDKPDGINAEYTFAVKACSQPFQLDIWSRYDAVRDQLENDLDDILHKGEQITLGVANGELVRDGVLLALDPRDGHEGFLDFTFEGPRKIHDGNAAQVNEFRSMIGGFVNCELHVKATTAKLARVKLQMALGPLGQDAANFTLTKNEAGTGFEITSSSL